MLQKSNINYLIEEKDKKNKIIGSLKSLFYKNSTSCSKLAAIKYLAPLLQNDSELKEKFEFLYHKETDFYIRDKMAEILGFKQDFDLI
jgi:hypothetical protein